jgi:arylsulfotransferase ASST
MEQHTLRRRATGLTGLDRDRAFPGYTLYAPLAGDGLVRLVDLAGEVAHEWRMPYRPGRHPRLLPGGTLAYNGAHPDGPELFAFWDKYRGGVMSEVAPDGTVLREYRDPMAHHDAHHLGGGRILYAALEALSPAEASAVPGGLAGSEADGVVYADVLKEVDGKGNLVWSWRAIEHLDPADYPLQPHYWREHWPLINSVYPLSDGNVLASLRSVSSVIVIERSSGKVIWRLGPDVLAQQHNATELPDGRFLIFDNGVFRDGVSVPFSRVIEVDPATKEIVWSYRDSPQEAFFTPFMGSAQRLGNGNTLVTESAYGRIFEVTRDGAVCWEYVVPEFNAYTDARLASAFPAETNAIFRAYRYAEADVPWLG